MYSNILTRAGNDACTFRFRAVYLRAPSVTPPPRRKGHRPPLQEATLRFPLVIITTVAAGLHATAARAGEVPADPKVTATLARHYTTNALDGPVEIEDWYTVLRGALEGAVAHDLGVTRLGVEMELRRFDTYDIENDDAFGLTAETTVQASDTLELRGTLSVKLMSEGDDMPAGDFILGTRTDKAEFAAALQAGLRLAPDTVLVLEGAASHEHAGMTRFEQHVIPPLRLEPHRDRLRVGATLTRTHAPYSYGVSATGGWRRATAAGFLPEIVLLEYGAKLLGEAAFENGATVGLAAGLQGLRLTNGAFSEIRPTYELTAAAPLPGGFSLRGAFRGEYDTISTDDPVAAWVRRLEAEAGYQATLAVRLGAGAFAEQRDNLALENREHVHGLYGEAAWQANERVAFLLRLDAKRNAIPMFNIDYRSVDVRVAVTVGL